MNVSTSRPSGSSPSTLGAPAKPPRSAQDRARRPRPPKAVARAEHFHGGGGNRTRARFQPRVRRDRRSGVWADLVRSDTSRFNFRVIRAAQLASALRVAVRSEDIRRVELAWGAAIAAEWAHFVALGVFAYEQGGAAAVGIAGFVRLLPAGVLAPFAASLGDRFRRERFLLAMVLIAAAALAGSGSSAFAGDLVSVFVLSAIVGLSTTLIRPALQALLPSLARTPEELIASNGATSTIESLGTLVGPFFAGVLVALADVGSVFVIAAAALVAAAALLGRVRVESRINLTATAEHETARQLIAAGFRTIANTPGARLLVGLIAAQTFVRGCLNVLIVVAAFRVFDGGAADVGYLTAAIGLGGLLGGFGAMTLEGRRLAVPFGLSLVFWGVPIAIIAPRPY